jgi:hypothetical protein
MFRAYFSYPGEVLRGRRDKAPRPLLRLGYEAGYIILPLTFNEVIQELGTLNTATWILFM